MDLLSELDTIKADYSAAQTLLEEAKASHDVLKLALDTKDSALAEKDEAIKAHLESIAAKDAENAGLLAQLSELKAKQKTAEEKAVEIVASQGIAPLKVDSTGKGEKKTKEEVLAEYLSIKEPKAKAAFYRANREAIYGI